MRCREDAEMCQRYGVLLFCTPSILTGLGSGHIWTLLLVYVPVLNTFPCTNSAQCVAAGKDGDAGLLVCTAEIKEDSLLPPKISPCLLVLP